MSSPKKRKTVRSEGQFLDARYGWFVGKLMDKFISELGNKNLLASKCPECGYVCIPPREYCFKCYTEVGEDDVIELSGRGTLIGFTTAFTELDGRGNFEDLDEAKIIGAIRPDGADSTLFMQVGEIDPEDVEIGMEVEIEWVEEPEGELSDLKFFKPAKS